MDSAKPRNGLCPSMQAALSFGVEHCLICIVLTVSIAAGGAAQERVARLEAELAASGAEKALKTADPAELAKLNKEMLTLRHELRDVKSSRDHAARARETELQGQVLSEP